MRKAIIVPALVLLIAAWQLPAYADSDTDLDVCVGSGGYSGTTWSTGSPEPTGTLGSCPGVSVSSDVVFTAPVPSPTVPPNAPPPPTIDPNSPLGTIFSIVNSVCIPEPALCPAVISLLPTFWSPVTPIGVSLTGTGSFACGNGTLSGTGSIFDFVVAEPDFSLNWTATFTNGIGTVTGTATADCAENGIECGQVKTLGGTLLVVDGAPVQCNDSAGSSQVVALLTVSP